MTNLEKVKKLYEEGLTSKEISEKLSMKGPNVVHYLNKAFGKDRPKYARLLPKIRKYTLNENYFDDLNSEDKFYFLGLLYADGCVNKTSTAVQIALQEKDIHILETFKNYINSNKPLGFINGKKILGFNHPEGKEYIRKNQHILVINSKKIKNRLSELGLSSNKSLTIKFPKFIKNENMNHFVRGYFDGDGGIHVQAKNKWEISIAGNKEFCEDLSLLLISKNINSKCSKHSFGNVWYVRIYGRLNCIDFYNYLYKNSNVYLIRKFSKFQECIKSSESIRYGNSWKKEQRSDS
jgi:hypothetical protein